MPARSTLLFRLAALAAAIAAPAAARADDLRLEAASLPAPMLDASGQFDLLLEASGVQPIGDGHRLLIAHDKHPALYVVDAATGRILGAPITSPHFPAASKLGGPKWEGMARDAEGNYYLIGAHVGKTDEERASKSALIRFRLAESDQPAIDDASIVRWDIARSLVTALKADGLDDRAIAKRKIEGLALRDSKTVDGRPRRELLIGLRAPHDKVRVFAADVTSAAPGAELDLKPAFSFDAGQREGVTCELTALEYDPTLAGSLIITASEDDNNAFHGNTLWFVADEEPIRPRKIGVFEVAMKAEGLTVLAVEKAGKRIAAKLLITFDNDPHATKIPSRYQTLTLVREAD